MTRRSSEKKEKLIVKEFQRLLRSGKDFPTVSMYKDAAAKYFIEGTTAGNIIRKHYQNLITKEMRLFVYDNSTTDFNILMKQFSEKYEVCEREARYLIGYMR